MNILVDGDNHEVINFHNIKIFRDPFLETLMANKNAI